MIEITKPEELGFSSKRLERLTEWLGEQVSGDRLAGASVLVGRRGKVAYFESAGEADKELSLIHI